MLKDVQLKNAKPKEKPYRLFDGKGLYLEVAPKGGRYWRIKYRFGGKEKRLALGVYPEVSLGEARESTDEIRKLLRKGVDPAINRKVLKAATTDTEKNSFKAVAREWIAKFSSNWAQNHTDKIVRRLERDIFPWFKGCNRRFNIARCNRLCRNNRPRLIFDFYGIHFTKLACR
jgi:hypothetical protein